MKANLELFFKTVNEGNIKLYGIMDDDHSAEPGDHNVCFLLQKAFITYRPEVGLCVSASVKPVGLLAERCIKHIKENNFTITPRLFALNNSVLVTHFNFQIGQV